VLIDYWQRKIGLIEVSCPADLNVAAKEEEKLLKHRDIVVDFSSKCIACSL